MNEKLINVMLVDDNNKFRESLENVLEKDGSYKVVGSYWDGISIVEKVKKLKPDLLILDILLPFTDGLSMIKAIMEDEMKDKPMIVVASAITSEKIVKQAMNYGATYYIAKPCTPDNVKQGINMILCDYKKVEETKSHKAIDIRVMIEKDAEKLLTKIGMPRTCKGYNYILKGIVEGTFNNELLVNITKGLYKTIGAYFNVTKESAEIAMRRAILKTFDRGNQNELLKLFKNLSPEELPPSCGLFFSIVCEEIKSKNTQLL